MRQDTHMLAQLGKCCLVAQQGRVYAAQLTVAQQDKARKLPSLGKVKVLPGHAVVQL